MNTVDTPFPDGHEYASWSRRASTTERRDALIARITDATRITATFALDDGASLTLSNILTEKDDAGLRRIARWGVWFYLVNADFIAAVVPVAEPAWASCRAVMDRDSEVWSRYEGGHEFYSIDGYERTPADLAREYGPIRPLVDADGHVISDEDIEKGEY